MKWMNSCQNLLLLHAPELNIFKLTKQTIKISQYMWTQSVKIFSKTEKSVWDFYVMELFKLRKNII